MHSFIILSLSRRKCVSVSAVQEMGPFTQYILLYYKLIPRYRIYNDLIFTLVPILMREVCGTVYLYECGSC